MTQSELNELQNLPLDEKIRLVQLLWEEIAKEQSYEDLPEDHKKILTDRLNKIKRGNAKFRTWQEIRKKYIIE